jgi:hypothetical protein
VGSVLEATGYVVGTVTNMEQTRCSEALWQISRVSIEHNPTFFRVLSPISK